MSCCRNAAMVCIFGINAVLPATNVFTSCLIASDVPNWVSISPSYHNPMLCQLPNSFFRDFSPGGKKEMIIWPATPPMGGMSGSGRIGLTSFTADCDVLAVASVGFTSGYENQEALYSQLGGSWSEKLLSATVSVSGSGQGL